MYGREATDSIQNVHTSSFMCKAYDTPQHDMGTLSCCMPS